MTTKLIKGEKYDTDTLNLTGWTGPHEGLSYLEYFTRDGEYKGADQDGVEPLFDAIEDNGDEPEPKITLEICDNHEWLTLYGSVRDRNDDELDVESMREFRSLLETEIEKRLPQADCVRPRNGRTICHQWNGAHFTHKIGPVGTFANLTDLQVAAINEAVDVATDWAKTLGEPLRPVIVTYTDGRTENYANYEAALDSLGVEYGPDMVAEHDGDLSEGGDRTLVWASENASENDDGAKAVASIRWAE